MPRPKAGEILVRIEAAGINRPDIMQRRGLYPPPPGSSDIPGLEFAGAVVALGDGAQRFKLGDKVTALVSGGAYAEYGVVHESNALPVPAGLCLIEAAAIPETFFTVWSNLFDRGGLSRGESVLIHGGSSGIGTTAIQLAKAFGARPIVTAGSDAKCAACLTLGAEAAINYRSRDFVEEVKHFTRGKGVDVILDMIGGDYAARNFRAAAQDGRILQIATMKGARAEVDLGALMLKRLTHAGSTLRSRPIEFKAAIAGALENKVWPLLAAGQVKPVIDSTFPLSRANEAHIRMESSLHIGKIVLTMG